MIYLKQSTASQEIPLGYFLDSTNGDAEETGLTIANTDIKLWKTGATTLANKNSGGATHISNGIYYATLDATDSNTLGPLVIFVHVSGALANKVECLVLPAATYDALITNGLNDISTAQVNTECDTAITDAALATAAALTTAQNDLDIITGADGVNLLSGTQASIDAIETDTNSLNDTKIPQTLNLTASGNIGIDWANVENPTTPIDLSATDIQLCDTVTTNTDMRGTDSALLAANVPTNFSDLSISATTGLVDITQTAADKVWSTVARTLTAGTNIVLAKGVGVTGFNDVASTDIVSGGAITTSSGVASADTKKINGATVNGVGTSGNLWRGA